jgi:hypothetical protein
MQRQQQAEELFQAPRFNIFRLLGVAHLEDQTHSPFLADLLNPRGTHGQGHLFLTTFLQYCAQKWPRRPFQLSEEEIQTGSWHIQREVGISLASGQGGFMDIVLLNSNLRCVIVIENKIYAGEQWEQLQRYRQWLEVTYPNCDQALIFLTPRGRKAESGRALSLSYRKDIVTWLEAVLPHVQASNIQTIIKQYVAIIAATEAPVRQSNPFLQLMLEPDNLPLIRAITKQFEAFCVEAHRHFWREFGRALQARFVDSPYTVNWDLRLVEQKHVNNYWHGCYLQPKVLHDNQAQLRFAFRQGHLSQLPHFYFGLRWLENRPHPQYTDFQTRLCSPTPALLMKLEEPNWSIFHRFSFGPNSDEFLRNMYQSPETFIVELADLFWQFFEKNEAAVIEINGRQSVLPAFD